MSKNGRLNNCNLPPGMEPLLSKLQLAKWLSVSPRTIDRTEADGELPPALVFNRGTRVMKRWSPKEVRDHVSKH